MLSLRAIGLECCRWDLSFFFAFYPIGLEVIFYFLWVRFALLLNGEIMRNFSKYSRECGENSTAENDISNLTAGDVEEISIDSVELIGELKDIALDNERLSDNIEALEAIQEEIRNKGTEAISTESAALLGRLMASGTGLSTEAFIPSSLSMEAIEGRKRTMLHQMVLNIANVYQRILDWNHHNLTLFNVQNSRLKTIARELKDIKTRDDLVVSTKITKYLLTGNPVKEIETSKEYASEFRKLKETSIPFMKSAAEIADEDLFASFKQLWAFITMSSDKLLRNRFISTCELLEKAAKSSHMKVHKKTPVRVEMASEVLLGQGQFVVIYPPKAAYSDPTDTTAILDSMNKIYMGLYRMEKFRLGTIGSGWIDMKVNKRDMEQIISDAQDILDTANNLLTFTSKLSSYMSGWVNGSATGPNALGGIDDYQVPAFTRTGRLLNRISMIIIESVPPAYNFSLGNVKKAATIAEKFISKAS